MTMPMPVTGIKPKRYTVRDALGKIVGRAELREVPLNVIKIDADYQRPVSQQWLADHLPFDRQKSGAIVLSSRAGGPYCLDGHHRVSLARAGDTTHIAALVIDGLAKTDEARLFTQYQRDRRNLQSFDLYRADVVAGDPDTLAIVRIVHAAGFDFAKKGSPRGITAIDGVRYIHRLGGDDLLSRTLDFVKRLWLEEQKSLSGQVLKGLALFLAHAGQQPSFQRERLEKVMTNASPTKVVRIAEVIADRKKRSTSARPIDIAEALLESYNKLTADAQQRLPAVTVAGKKPPK